MNLKNSFRIAVLIVSIVLCLIALSACDDVSETNDYDYVLRVKSVEIVDGEVVVHVDKSGDGDEIVGTEGVYRVWTEYGDFYNEIKTVFDFDGETIFSATENFLAQYGGNYGVEDFSSLKIVFDYDTIYKSTKSDGEVSKVGGGYVHSHEIVRGENSFTLERRYPRSSSWYGLTAGVAVFAVVVAGVAVLIKRGKYGR